MLAKVCILLAVACLVMALIVALPHLFALRRAWKAKRAAAAKSAARGPQGLVSVSAEELLLEIVLPVIDDLDRALVAGGPFDASGSAAAFVRGIELIRKRTLHRLANHGIMPFESFGKLFDPGVHEAVKVVESDGAISGGTIIQVFTRGYWSGGLERRQLLRPALVAVVFKAALDQPLSQTGDAP